MKTATIVIGLGAVAVAFLSGFVKDTYMSIYDPEGTEGCSGPFHTTVDFVDGDSGVLGTMVYASGNSQQDVPFRIYEWHTEELSGTGRALQRAQQAHRLVKEEFGNRTVQVTATRRTDSYGRAVVAIQGYTTLARQHPLLFKYESVSPTLRLREAEGCFISSQDD